MRINVGINKIIAFSEKKNSGLSVDVSHSQSEILSRFGRMFPGDTFTVSLMVGGNQNISKPTVSVRSDEIIGREQESESSSRGLSIWTFVLPVIGSLLAMSILVITQMAGRGLGFNDIIALADSKPFERIDALAALTVRLDLVGLTDAICISRVDMHYISF